jgi:hypothetical protein
MIFVTHLCSEQPAREFLQKTVIETESIFSNQSDFSEQ